MVLGDFFLGVLLKDWLISVMVSISTCGDNYDYGNDNDNDDDDDDEDDDDNNDDDV
jgi:hypothetical protein